MTVAIIIGAVAVILGLWVVAFEVNRVGNALWQIQTDMHDIRCSINRVGEPAHKLLKSELEKHAAERFGSNERLATGDSRRT